MVGETEFSVKATLAFDDGKPVVSCKAIGRVSYAGRIATRDVEIVDQTALDAIAAALAGVLTDEVRATLKQYTTVDAFEALVVATRKGEQV